jgi:hypothetical protein
MRLWLVSLLGAAIFGLASTTGYAQAAAPTIAGKWSLTSDASSDGPSTLEIKLDGTKVTGTIVGPSGTYAVAGTYVDGKLVFAMDYQGQLTITFTGKLLEDGSLAGTMDYGQGPVNWKAVRAKGAIASA